METKRQKAYKYVLDERKGTQSKLISTIGQELFDEFCILGFITQGADAKWEKRWRITNFGQKQFSDYVELDARMSQLITLS